MRLNGSRGALIQDPLQEVINAGIQRILKFDYARQHNKISKEGNFALPYRGKRQFNPFCRLNVLTLTSQGSSNQRRYKIKATLYIVEMAQLTQLTSTSLIQK